MDKVKSIPQEVQEVIKGILEVLDTEYGTDRNYKDDGGVIVISKIKAKDIH